MEGLRFVDIPVAEITDPGGLVHSVVGEWHLLGGALGTHTLATVPTVVLRYTELYNNQQGESRDMQGVSKGIQGLCNTHSEVSLEFTELLPAHETPFPHHPLRSLQRSEVNN